MSTTEEVLLLLSARDSTQGVLRSFASGISDLMNRSKAANDILQLQAAATTKLDLANMNAVLRVRAVGDAQNALTTAQNASATSADRVALAEGRHIAALDKLAQVTNRARAGKVQLAKAYEAEQQAAINLSAANDAQAGSLDRIASSERALMAAQTERLRSQEALAKAAAEEAAASQARPSSPVAGFVTGGVAAAALAAVALGGYSIEQSLQYNQQLTNVGARTGTSPAGMAKIDNAIMKYMASGKDLQSGDSLANGAYPLLSAGLTPTQSAALIPLAAGVGSVAGVDTAAGSNAITDLADTFGKGPKSTQADFQVYANQLIAAGQKGKVPFSQLIPSITKFAGTANVAGVSSADALAWLDKQTLSGATSARGAVGLSAFLTSMVLKPTAYTQAAGQRMGFETGSNAIKDAGGLFQYVQSLKDVGALDPKVMARILGQKNAALGVDYLFTGGGLSGSEGSPMNIASNIATNRKALSNAQGDQLQSEQAKLTATFNRFNQDAIRLGTALNNVLVPAILTAASGILDIIDKLPDAGGLLDKFFKTTHLSDVGVTTSNILSTVGYAALGPLGGLVALQNMSDANKKKQDAADAQKHTVTVGVPKPGLVGGLIGSQLAEQGSMGRYLVPHLSAPVDYSLTPVGGNSPPESAQHVYASRYYAQQGGRNQIAFEQQNVAAEQNFTNPSLANKPYQDDVHQLTILLAGQASNKALDAQLTKIKTDLGNAAYSPKEQALNLSSQQNRVGTFENNRLVSSYNDMYKAAQIFSESVKLNHGSVAQQVDAANKQYYAAVALAGVQRAKGKIDQLGYLNAIDAAGNTQATSIGGARQQGLGALQDKLTLGALQGSNVAPLVASVVAYMTANASALGLNKTQLAIQTLQLEQQYGQTSKIAPANLIRPNVGSLSSAEAPFGTSIAQLSGSADTQDRALALMQSQLNAANSTITQLRQEVSYLSSIKDGVTQVALNTSKGGVQRKANKFSSIPKTGS